jgi:AraC-like DNA-binding protein
LLDSGRMTASAEPSTPDHLRVVRGQVPGGSWELIYGRCHRALIPYVREYCGYREQTAGPVRRREMPAAQVVMILDFGPTLRLVDAAEKLVAHAGGFVAGIDDGFTVTETPGAMSGIQVNFTPIGARLLLGRPMHELARQVVSLPDALGPDGRHLTERLHEAPGWPARFRELDRILLARLRAAESLPPWVAAAWDRLEASGGKVGVADLVEEIGYSRKHLAAVFREHVGMPPKAIARLLRFQRALEAIRAGRAGDLSRLALDLGYYDQAHFTREFRTYAGLTPAECRRRQGPGTLGIEG